MNFASTFRSLFLGVAFAIAAVAASADTRQGGADIVDTAVAAGSFKTLVTAIQAAGLVDTLKGDGPFTVFAPTDEAFAKLPAGTLDALLKDKEALSKVLTTTWWPARSWPPTSNPAR